MLVLVCVVRCCWWLLPGGVAFVVRWLSLVLCVVVCCVLSCVVVCCVLFAVGVGARRWLLLFAGRCSLFVVSCWWLLCVVRRYCLLLCVVAVGCVLPVVVFLCGDVGVVCCCCL